VKIIADIPYIKVVRMIEHNTQYHKEEVHYITLSKEKVITFDDSFLLHEVLDISYRFFSKEMGFLYLHTTKGMYSYTVRTNPQSFIDHYKRIK
jgi:hypothetical protein